MLILIQFLSTFILANIYNVMKLAVKQMLVSEVTVFSATKVSEVTVFSATPCSLHFISVIFAG